MFSSEIKETIFIAVSAVLLASLLGFVSYLMMLRSEFADARANEIRVAHDMTNYREFNTYNDRILFGEDLVAAIRDYYDTDVKIAVKDLYGDIIYYMDKDVAKTPAGKAEVEIGYLQNQFPTNNKYEAVLVYGEVDLETVTLDYDATSINNNVSAIVFFHTGTR